MPSTRETRDSILRRIARTEWTPRGLAFWRTPAGIERFRSYMPDSDSSSTASSETCSEDDEENPPGSPWITPATFAHAVPQPRPPPASSLPRQASHRETRDAHHQNQASVSAAIAASIASPFSQSVSMSDAENQRSMEYSPRNLREEIQRGRSRSPARGLNGERMRADDRPMDAANFEYEELAARNGLVRLPRQTADELHFEADFRRQHAQVRAQEMAAAAVRAPAADLLLPGSGSNRGEDGEDEEAGWPWHRMDQPMDAFFRQMRKEDCN